MRRSSIAVAALSALGMCRGIESQVPFDPRPVPWRNDLDSARKLALERGKPLLVVFR